MFNSLFTENITMTWRSGDAYVNGVFVEGSEQSKTIIASVQPVTGSQRELLGEGFRNNDVITIFTEENSVQTIVNNALNITDAAQFQYNSKTYYMLSCERWNYLIPHWKIVAIAKD